MDILVIDGMGGGIGKTIIEGLKGAPCSATITAVGTNALATAAMLKAGADFGATGENAVVYNCQKADYIVGAMGILVANAMHGEISPNMALAVSASAGHKFLIPIGTCGVTVLGATPRQMQAYIGELVELLQSRD